MPYFEKMKLQRTVISMCLIIIALLFSACSTDNEKNLKGKWVLEGMVIGSFPKSYWFQSLGKVVAPWEDQNRALRSSGRYEFIDDTHIKIVMTSGYFNKITYFYQIVTVNREKLILRGSIQDIRFKRAE